jgi:3',5'-cyclic AMP phosphodiesterase CpdA
MQKRDLFLIWFIILNLFIWTAPGAGAVPLSLDQNIQAILAKKAEIEKGFDFVVLGDSRDGADVYARLLTRAGGLHPLFIIHTGDFVRNGSTVEYENYSKQIAGVDIPMVHLPGNHDLRTAQDIYRQYVGDPNWYFDLGDIRFIGLDNGNGKFTPEAVALARKTLTNQKTCLVAFHYPPAIGRWAVHAMAEDQRGGQGGVVMDLIKKAQAPLVFLGHIHLYDEMDIDGTQYVITAGGGARLYSKYNFGKPEYGFLLVQVRPQGITHRWVPLD